MQIKNNRPNYPKKSWIIGLKLLLLTVCLYFIFHKLEGQSVSLNNLSLPYNLWSIISIVSVLMIFNWYLEALRWKLSVQQFESISIQEAWQAVLGGLSLNWVLPFTSGDLIARIAQRQDKYQTTSAAILNRGIMLVLTVFLGLFGMSFMAREYNYGGLFLLGILFGIPILKRLFKKTINRFLEYFRKLTSTLVIKLITLSVLRYAVFILQFYLLLAAFLPTLDVKLIIAGIGWIFLVRSVLPLFFGGVGVREASGVFFFEPYVAELDMVIVPIFLIWSINTLLPSLAGLLLVMRSKPPYFK